MSVKTRKPIMIYPTDLPLYHKARATEILAKQQHASMYEHFPLSPVLITTLHCVRSQRHSRVQTSLLTPGLHSFCCQLSELDGHHGDPFHWRPTILHRLQCWLVEHQDGVRKRIKLPKFQLVFLWIASYSTFGLVVLRPSTQHQGLTNGTTTKHDPCCQTCSFP